MRSSEWGRVAFIESGGFASWFCESPIHGRVRKYDVNIRHSQIGPHNKEPNNPTTARIHQQHNQPVGDCHFSVLVYYL